MKKILVLCTGNSCRSQMAEGYLRLFARDSAIIYSAGVATHGVNPIAVDVMREDGVDLSHHTSNHVEEYKDVAFDLVITVCDHAKEQCPWFLSKARRFHQDFPDPAKTTGTSDEVKDAFCSVRDAIKIYCRDFASQYI